MAADRSWTRHGLLVAPPAGHARWSSHAQAPTALVLAPRLWRVYFAGRDAANRSRIFFADLDPEDGMRVLRVHDRPLLECGAPGSFDVHGMGPATALRVGAQVWLYYSGIAQRRDVPYQIAIGLALSDDGGETFRRAFEGPVLGASAHDPRFVSTPFVWRDGARWRAIFNSATQWLQHDGHWECLYDLREAESTDGIAWMAQPRSVLGLAQGEAGLARPWLLRSGTGWEMWFSHRGIERFRSAEGEAYRLQGAHSADGRHWQRAPGDIVWSAPPRPGDWDGWMQAYPCVVPHRDRLVMFYNGNDFGRGGFGWASAPADGATACG